jgi:hypothetical protein
VRSHRNAGDDLLHHRRPHHVGVDISLAHPVTIVTRSICPTSAESRNGKPAPWSGAGARIPGC